MYVLMNKDNEVMRFTRIDGALGASYQVISQNLDMLPYGFETVGDWINGRKGSKHNAHLKELMQMCGCEHDAGYIKITHAATLNDTYWVKEESENVTWNEISLYRNEFNEQISKLAFEGIGLYGIQMSSTSPELSTEGSFRKCWKREDNGIFLYKRGSSGASNAGLEPYCEMMASEFAAFICRDAVSYNTVQLHGELASKCKLFTNEQYGYVPYSKLGKDNSANAMLDFYSSIGSEDDFRRMLVLDAVTFNVDRHAGNHGVLAANDSKEILRMSPVFDLNLALLPFTLESEFPAIGDKMLQYGPRIGDDFTRIGQMSLTSAIRSDLINLKGFQFSFRGDDKFSPERVKFMEQMINRQIEAVLSKDVLYTKDVFVPQIQLEPQEIQTEDADWVKEQNIVAHYVRDLIPEPILYSIETDFEQKTVFLNVELNSNTELKISMRDFSTELLRDGIHLECLEQNAPASNVYIQLTMLLDNLDYNTLVANDIETCADWENR